MQILALVPMTQESGGDAAYGHCNSSPTEKWEKGWEMIVGAEVAINTINSDPTVLRDTILRLVTVDINSYTVLDGLVSFVGIVTDEETNSNVAMIGVHTSAETALFSPLATNLKIDLQFSISMSPKTFDDQRYSQQVHMVQSVSILAKALFELMEFYEWTVLSIVASNSDAFYIEISEDIHRLSKQYSNIVVVNSINFDISNDQFFTTLRSNLIVVSMGISDVVSLICSAYSKNLTWPRYAWVILGHSVDDFERQTENRSNCSLKEATEGIIFTQQHLTVSDQDMKLISGVTYRELSQIFEEYAIRVNPYANVLYDSVWTIALALNSSMQGNDTDISTIVNNIDYYGASGHVTFVDNERKGLRIDILQMKNTSTISVGYFINGNLTINSDHFIGNFDQIDYIQSTVYQKLPVVYIIVHYCNVAICTIFTTVILLLYLYFKDEAIIKATSTLLSMMIFVSCYLVFFFLLISNLTFLPYNQNLSDGIKNFTCIVRLWLNGLAVPSNIIFSTLIVKTIRVYRIFRLTPIMGNKFHSNLMMYTEIFILMVPVLVILTLWSAIDTYSFKITHYIRDTALRKTVVVEQCDSDYLIIWLVLLLLYLIILMVSLVVVAVKTRKIRYENFKDTKKFNALIFTLILTYSLTLSYWFTLRSVQDTDLVLEQAVLQFGHILSIYELMGFLFVPKIYPLIKEKWFKRVHT